MIRRPYTVDDTRRNTMETFGTSDSARASGQRLANDIGEGVNAVKNVASAEIRNLIADVEDLVARIADLKDADVARVRSKVLKAVDAAKEGLVDRADTLRRQARQAVASADDYVHDRPWQAVGIAAVVGAVVGILATRRS
jgi:ElaB/YqjD/DUF883 family membrane-anchored ribosome-binding protein